MIGDRLRRVIGKWIYSLGQLRFLCFMIMNGCTVISPDIATASNGGSTII